MKKLVLSLLLVAATLSNISAQEIKLSGQFRERSEFDTKSFNIGQSSDVFHWLRSRLRADVAVNDQVKVVLEMQDARQFGQRGTTLNVGSPSFDLRQGYLEVANLGNEQVSVRLGRQVLSYANERLLGGIDWNNYGQSFDAGLLRLGSDEFFADIFGAAIARNSNPVNGYTRDVFLAGAWFTWRQPETKNTIQAFYLYDNPALPVSLSPRQQRSTAGIYVNENYSGFDLEMDGAFQFGTIPETRLTKEHSISANMVGLRVGYTLKDYSNLRIGIGVDRLSGTDPKSADTTYGAFNTLYGTNHKFYGFMDYFTDIPGQTSTMGLMDLIGQISFEPMKGAKLAVDVHLFSTVIDPKDYQADATETKTIGKEIDITGWFKIAKAVNLTCGFSIFDKSPDRPLLTLGRKTTNWAYVMTTVNF
jgi:hypothetical protein